MVGTNIVLGAGPRGTRPITNAFGRKLPLITSIFKQIERPLSGKADIRVVSVLSVSPQSLWAKDTKGLPKRPFKSLILKGEKRVKAAINSMGRGAHFDTLGAA